MAKFKVNRSDNFTVMSNHHLRNRDLSLKAKGLLSQMLSLPPDWDYTLKGLAYINKEKVDAIRTAVWELERAGYIKRYRERNEAGQLLEMIYEIYELPQDDITPHDKDSCHDNFSEEEYAGEALTDGDKIPENDARQKEEAERTDSEKNLQNKGFSPKPKNSVLDKNGSLFTECSPKLENPTLDKNDSLFTECSPRLDFPTLENPTLENPTQINKDIINRDILNKDILNNINISNDVDKSYHILSNLKNKIRKEKDKIRCDEEQTHTEIDFPDTRADIRDRLKKNTCYEYIIHDSPFNKYMVEEIIETITETLIRCEKEDTILVSSFTYPADMVKQRLYSLNEEHIKYVINCMRDNTSSIRNIKKYLLAALFNAPSTMHTYAAAEVSKDMLKTYKEDD